MHPVETYLRALRDNRSAGVAETSNYAALAALLNAAGAQLKPRVRCVLHPKSDGAGIPDAALFTADQFPRGGEEPLAGVLPERGAVEAKQVSANVYEVAESAQVARYLTRYGQVLVTNFRDWLIVERGSDGKPVVKERFRMAESEAVFWSKASNPRTMAGEVGDRLIEYLQRVMLRPVPLVNPKDVAWLLAAYARDARFRVERGGALPALSAIREALEEALGVSFRGERGEHFFRSTLVQTLFYGIFSGWTLWARKGGSGSYDWRTAMWHLRVPVIEALFGQIAVPARLGPLKLVEVLDWAGESLNRIDRIAFFAKFAEEHAIQYFYEPFLEAFDPQLRKDLGVWYTPPEVVKYIVARVDMTLREELGITDGLADKRVLVLDPCCGTGAFLVEVLKQIGRTLRERGEDALLNVELQRAASERVLGFEIMPAPFVIAHLQLGLLLNPTGNIRDYPVDNRRLGVFLTNALTGWEPADDQKMLALPELRAERDAAEHVKRDARVLVVIGNPPYNGYPGLAIGEERGLVEAYRQTKHAPKPEGQGLNDLYVRFFRIAERRIVELTGKGIVCFISNHSWLDGLSHSGMRERYLEVFDQIFIDALNGDSIRTGKLTPDRQPDPSVFSTEWNREGIEVGTAVSLMFRSDPHEAAQGIRFRDFWGRDKRIALLRSVDASYFGEDYESVTPEAALGFPFRPRARSQSYLDWPSIPELFPVTFHGVKTSCDDFVVDIDRSRLEKRIDQYFDVTSTDDEIRQRYPTAMRRTERFHAEPTRAYLLSRGRAPDAIYRHAYRPFDLRWLYWEPETKLLDEKRSDFRANTATETLYLASQKRSRREWSPPLVTRGPGDLVLLDPSTTFTPMRLAATGSGADLFTPTTDRPRPNLSDLAKEYLRRVEAHDDDLFFHVVCILHAPGYRAENDGALRQGWPRIPLPSDYVHLHASAELGRSLVSLLDPEQPLPGITCGTIREELRVIGVPARAGGGPLGEADFALTAGWGHPGKTGTTMPARGRTNERRWTDDELGTVEAGSVALGLDASEAVALLGETVLDVYLNEHALWRCVPKRVWEYTLGGYQVLKKWLSYREQAVLGRPLTLEEVREVTSISRRIAAILLMEPALDAAYTSVKGETYL